MDAENIIFGIMYIFVGLILMVISYPLIKGNVAMNHTYGVRLKKSFTSEENWYLMNRYGGKQLVIWSGVVAALGVVTLFIPFNGNEPLILLMAIMPIAVLAVPVLMIVRYSKTLSG